MRIHKHEARIAELESQLWEARDERDEARKIAQDVDAQGYEDQTERDEAEKERAMRERDCATARENEANALHDMARAEGRRDVWKERAQRYWRIVEQARAERDDARENWCNAQNRATYLLAEVHSAQRDTEARFGA